MPRRIRLFAQAIERAIIHVLIFLMSLVLLLATVELGWQIAQSIIAPPFLRIDIARVLDLFGIFLLVLIGIELLDTIKVYFKQNVVNVEVVILVAIIAIARKVIVLEPKDYDPTTLLGIAAVIIALSSSYYLLKQLGSGIVFGGKSALNVEKSKNKKRKNPDQIDQDLARHSQTDLDRDSDQAEQDND